MKCIPVILFCLMACKSFAQKDEALVEEKSSSWVKVVNNETEGKPKTATVKRKVNSSPSRKANSQQEFDKTNNEVNRFKKSKNN